MRHQVLQIWSPIRMLSTHMQKTVPRSRRQQQRFSCWANSLVNAPLAKVVTQTTSFVRDIDTFTLIQQEPTHISPSSTWGSEDDVAIVNRFTHTMLKPDCAIFSGEDRALCCEATLILVTRVVPILIAAWEQIRVFFSLHTVRARQPCLRFDSSKCDRSYFAGCFVYQTEHSKLNKNILAMMVVHAVR